MNFEVRTVTKHSLVLEMDNTSIVMTTPFTVSLNGTKAYAGNSNVITLTDLAPDTEYQVEVLQGTERTSRVIRTRTETCLLSVSDFGAKGDGKQDDTAFLQAAISACPAGGTVVIPKGTYLSGPLFLKSHLSLYLEEGAVILGKTDRTAYPVLPGERENRVLATWEGEPNDSFASLLTAIDATDLEIEGKGIVDGNAQNADWWVKPKERRIAWRPNLLFLNGCRDVVIAGLTFRNSPSWTLHPFYTDNLKVLGVTIQNPPDSPNTDGLDPESCKDVLILGVRICVGDDCIAIKSGKAAMAERYPMACEGLTIRNCIFERGHGSVTIGSEAAGSVRNVTVTQCRFDGTDRGLRIKTRRGRGPHCVYENIEFSNIEMTGVAMPVTVNMFYFCDPDGHSEYVQRRDPLPVDAYTPFVKSIRASNITCTGVEGALLCVMGLPEQPVGEIELSNISASFLPKAQRTPREVLMMDNFPKMEGTSIFARNVNRLVLNNVSFWGEDISDISVQDVKEFVRS